MQPSGFRESESFMNPVQHMDSHFYVEHVSLSVRLKSQRTARMLGHGRLAFEREPWMSKDRSAHVQLIDKQDGNPTPSVVKRFETAQTKSPHRAKGRKFQTEEWLGDSLLLFYARLYTTETLIGYGVGERDRRVRRYIENASLAKYATQNAIVGGANEMEIRIYRSFLYSPATAKDLCWKIFKFCDSITP